MVLALTPLGGRAAAGETPSLSLSLKPHATGAALDYLDATLVIRGVGVASGKTLVRMPLVAASIPTVRYDGEALVAADARGPLRLTQKDGAPGSMGTDRDWLAARASSGSITLRFRAVPRQVDANTRPGPLFDLRAESGGLDGAGLVFLPLPVARDRFRIRLHWDLSGLPAGDHAASCLGDGDASLTGATELLAQCYYMVGPVHVYPEGPDRERKFGIYWLTDTPFDVATLGAQIQRLFAYMSAFFHDDGGSYRVFIRKNPYPRGGGTALHRSFMFGWNSEHPPTVGSLQDLLAHEMTHNWPSLEAEHGDTSWYSEGTAEYYSILLSWRSGVIDTGEFLKRINERARNYYRNPLQSLTLRQAEERYWKEANASYVPYGRGFMYLARTDAQIREKSAGKRSLDDLVVELVDRTRRGKSHTIADWLRLLTRELGAGAGPQFEQMRAGVRLVPPPNTFGPCFRPETYQTRLTDFGFDESSLSGPGKLIRGVRPGSNAALAGLRDGDVVVQRTLPDQDDPGAELTFVVRRAGAERTIRFIPQGGSVEAWRWVRVPGIPDSSCRY
jgi:hypothetical protein